MKKIIYIAIALITAFLIIVPARAEEYDWSMLIGYSEEYSDIQDLLDKGFSDSEIITYLSGKYDAQKVENILNDIRIDNSVPDNSEDRLKALEERFNDLNLDFSALSEKYDYLELQQTEISDKLDILITILYEYKDLFYDYDTETPLLIEVREYLYQTHEETVNTKELINRFLHMVVRDDSDFEYLEEDITLSDSLTELGANIEESLTVTNEKTLEELNATLLVTNKFLTYLMVLVLIGFCLMIAFFVGKLIHNILNRNVY